MADNYTFPGGVNTYVPQLHQDLIIEFSRNPQAFPINQYINLRKVDKQVGYYVKMKNDNQGRIVNTSDVLWPDGNDAPETLYSNDQFDFPQFTCVRHAYVKRYGYLAVDQGAWDILDQGTRLLAQDAMTFRTYNIHQTLTTTATWGSNYDTATNLGGGVWSGATTLLPYIRKTLMSAFITIQKGTYSSVQFKDLYLVINPNVAKVIATSQEFINSFIQQPGVLAQWQGNEQFMKYNLPPNLFGMNVVVDDTVLNSALPGNSASFAYSLSDSYAILLSKQQAIKPAAGGSFSTFELFTYQDLETFVYNDVENRRYKVQVIDNTDTSSNSLVAPQSGFLVKIDS